MASKVHRFPYHSESFLLEGKLTRPRKFQLRGKDTANPDFNIRRKRKCRRRIRNKVEDKSQFVRRYEP